ncbi:MAG: TraR/DksA C4-type zinc finger protein [Caldibacillus sp.]
MLSQGQIRQLKQQLIAEKKDIAERLKNNDNFQLQRSHPHDSIGELSSYDNHPADEATELFERGKDLALKEHLEKQLEEIDRAVAAIAEGTYGRCAVCGTSIPYERLQTIPTTMYCKEHSPSQETSDHRPIEEKVFDPPFGQFDFDDERDESVIFDAEDAWQEVASWGTSESPSDFSDPPAHRNDLNIEPDEQLGYVEEYENFIAVDLYGNEVTIFPSKQRKKYEEALDEEGVMTVFGDLPAYEKEPYVED